jgi:hypothetical protein
MIIRVCSHCYIGINCIDYGNSSTAAKALSMARNVVDQASAKGANAIRLDELDMCQGGSQACQQNLNRVLTQVSKYAAQKGIGVVAADWKPSVQALQTASQNGGAPVIGGLTDGSDGDAGPFASIIGKDKPIFQVNSGSGS